MSTPADIRPEDEIYREDRCKRCGVCCGAADGHPCEHLRRDGDRYRCEIYGRHLGYHRTVDGLFFRCVSIRELIETSGGHETCAYVQALRAKRQEPSPPAFGHTYR